MNKKLKIFIFCMIFVSSVAFAQTAVLKKNNLMLSLQPPKPLWKPSLLLKPKLYTPLQPAFLPADFYAKQLGFFCKQEIKMDKVTRIPFRFRLGSVEQCDWLEGKKRQ